MEKCIFPGSLCSKHPLQSERSHIDIDHHHHHLYHQHQHQHLPNTIVTPITVDHCSINATQSNSLASHCRGIKFARRHFHFIMIHIIIIIITITMRMIHTITIIILTITMRMSIRPPISIARATQGKAPEPNLTNHLVLRLKWLWIWPNPNPCRTTCDRQPSLVVSVSHVEARGLPSLRSSKVCCWSMICTFQIQLHYIGVACCFDVTILNNSGYMLG